MIPTPWKEWYGRSLVIDSWATLIGVALIVLPPTAIAIGIYTFRNFVIWMRNRVR